MTRQYKDGEVVEWRGLDAEGKPVGNPLVVRYTNEGMVVVRPRAEDGGLSSSREETSSMEMIAPTNPLNDILGLLPLVKRWLEKQVGDGEEILPKASAKDSVPPVKEWFSPEEASVQINRTPNHVRELCRKKVFGKHDAGGRWVISRKELEAFRLGRHKVHGEVLK